MVHNQYLLLLLSIDFRNLLLSYVEYDHLIHMAPLCTGEIHRLIIAFSVLYFSPYIYRHFRSRDNDGTDVNADDDGDVDGINAFYSFDDSDDDLFDVVGFSRLIPTFRRNDNDDDDTNPLDNDAVDVDGINATVIKATEGINTICA